MQVIALLVKMTNQDGKTLTTHLTPIICPLILQNNRVGKNICETIKSPNKFDNKDNIKRASKAYKI